MAGGQCCGFLGGIDQPGGQVVIGVGVLETLLAGQAGRVGAFGAGCGPVAFAGGGDVQGGEQGLDFAGRDGDGVVTGWGARFGFGPGRYLVDIRAERAVQRAVIDVGQVAG